MRQETRATLRVFLALRSCHGERGFSGIRKLKYPDLMQPRYLSVNHPTKRERHLFGSSPENRVKIAWMIQLSKLG
jgi:hypothetical protein